VAAVPSGHNWTPPPTIPIQTKDKTRIVFPPTLSLYTEIIAYDYVDILLGNSRSTSQEILRISWNTDGLHPVGEFIREVWYIVK
jgi:hypothetical protein